MPTYESLAAVWIATAVLPAKLYEILPPETVTLSSPALAQ